MNAAIVDGLLAWKEFGIYISMETFATAINDNLRFHLTRIQVVGEGEKFYFSFFEESNLAQGPIADSVPVDARLARAKAGANPTPLSPATQIEVIGHVLEHGALRERLKIDQQGNQSPWIIKAFFRQIDAIVEANFLREASGGSNMNGERDSAPSRDKRRNASDGSL